MVIIIIILPTIITYYYLKSEHGFNLYELILYKNCKTHKHYHTRYYLLIIKENAIVYGKHKIYPSLEVLPANWQFFQKLISIYFSTDFLVLN